MLTPEKIKEMNAITGLNKPATPEQASGQARAKEILSLADTIKPDLVQKNSPYGTVGNALQNTSVGVAQGLLSTLKGAGTLVQKGLDATVNKVMPEGAKLGSDIYRPDTKLGQKATDIVTPQTTGQSFGYGAEKLAEFFIPASKAAQAEKAVNLISQGIKNPLLSATTRVVGKAGVQGLSAGGVNLVQTGGDLKEAGKTALTAGVTRAGMAIIGEGSRALHIPERLYSMIFKNSAKDMMTELKSNGITNLQRTNPEKYQDFVSKGIIKTGADGAPVLNDTLAEQALDKGLRGSIRNMADEVVQGTLDSENKVQQIAKTYTGTVDVSEPQIKNVLTKIGQDYTDVGFGEISKEADSFVSKITSSGGKVSAEDALGIRRLLDRVRIASSFDKPVTNLSQSQGNLKTLADAVRIRLNNVPGIGEVMKDYSFYIDAMEALAKEAARRGNGQVLSMIDSLFLSGAYAGNNAIPGVTMGILRRVLMSGKGLTTLASALNNSVVSPTESALISSGSSGINNLLK